MQTEGSPNLRQIPMQALAAAGAARLDQAIGAGPLNDTGDAGHAVESLFSTMLVRELRRGLPEGFFSGAGADVFTSWFDEYVGETLAKRDALGLSRLVESALDRRAAREAEASGEPEAPPEPVDAPAVIRARAWSADPIVVPINGRELP